MLYFGDIFVDESRVINENIYAFAIKDSYPVTEGHALIIPKRKVPSYFDLIDEEKQAMLELLEATKELLFDLYNPDGFNIGINDGEAAGQTIMHCHIHLIPRYFGDTKHPRGGVRGVIPNKQSY